MMLEKIAAVVGPTASGKTALAIRLAKQLNGEVISCDSMQIYRRMQIGTAAPTEMEMQGIPHHMIAVVDPAAPFSCADYAESAHRCIRDIRSRGKLPILCGGTGLYLDAVLRGSDFSEVSGSAEVRAELADQAQKLGVEALHARLAEVDPEAAASIHPNNVRRVIRALEIYQLSGVTKTEWDRRSQGQRRYDAYITVLDFHDRQRLYDRIDRRVDAMLEVGLEREVRALYEDGLLDPGYIAAQAIGYKEFLPYFAGERTLQETAEQIRQSSRRYAKRQLTWFRRYSDALWLYPDAHGEPLTDVDTLASLVVSGMQEAGFEQAQRFPDRKIEDFSLAAMDGSTDL